MLTGFDRDLIYAWLRKGVEIDPDHLLTIRSIKLNCDGALGSRGAWLLEPYTDRSDFSGMATLPMDTVLKTSREALKAGFQVCSHAIGDRANKEILDRYEIAFNENPESKVWIIGLELNMHSTCIPTIFLGLERWALFQPCRQIIYLPTDRGR
jgi:predicted amidohydrolase YtcJ